MRSMKSAVSHNAVNYKTKNLPDSDIFYNCTINNRKKSVKEFNFSTPKIFSVILRIQPASYFLTSVARKTVSNIESAFRSCALK